jgi:sensor histidine kinase YesM
MIKTGDKNFWIAQLIGWGLFAVLNSLLQFMALHELEESSVVLKQVIFNSLIAFTAGFAMTSVYRYILKRSRLNLKRISVTLLYIIVSTLILSFSFLLILGVVLFILQNQRFLTFAEVAGNIFNFSILMLIWNSLYFMIHYVHSWNNSESEKWQILAAMKEAQLGSLKAQINPHFMFNAINNIKALISEDPERAKEMLMNFSDMFRYSLIHNDKSLVTVREELEIVEKYLELLSIQFEEKLSYKITADPLLLERKIPPMVVQLLVENAVKHGISELAQGGEVDIDFMDEGEIFTLKVSNSGSIKESSRIQKKLGIGLQNIRERLALIYGDGTKLNLFENSGQVVAEIKFPLTLQNVVE